jgi:membrane fusion protein, adhesin transport system
MRLPFSRATAPVPAFDEVRHAIAQSHPPLWAYSSLLWVALLGAAGTWAWHAPLETITAGQGKVVSSSREQVIQSLEAGLLAELKVREGDVVEKDQVLLRIDDTRANASLREGNSKADALSAAQARLRAEVSGTALSFPPAVRSQAGLVQTETALYQARRRTVEESVAALQNSARLIEQELSMTEPLAARGMASEVEVLRLKRQASETRLQISERWNRYRSEAGTELARVESELAQVSSNVTARADSMRRTVVRAPLRGTIKNVRVNTVGGVIQSGQDIMSIVPMDEALLIEARIRPSDVAFLRPGMKATVKLSAYEFGLYGGLEGTVHNISPDTLEEERRSQPAQEPYYRVQVKTDQPGLLHQGKVLPVIPGMVATVEVLTGHRTVWDYLLRPILKSQEALRER